MPILVVGRNVSKSSVARQSRRTSGQNVIGKVTKLNQRQSTVVPASSVHAVLGDRDSYPQPSLAVSATPDHPLHNAGFGLADGQHPDIQGALPHNAVASESAITLLVDAPPHEGPPNLRHRRTRRKQRLRAIQAEVYSHEVTLSDQDEPPSPTHHPTPLNTRPLISTLTTTLLLLTSLVTIGHIPTILRHLHPAPSPPSPAPLPLLSLPSLLTPSSNPPSSPSSSSPPSPYSPPPSFFTSPVRVTFVTPRATPSPFPNTPWGDVISHLATRLHWNDPGYSLHIVYEDDLTSSGEAQGAALSAFSSSQIVIGTDIHEPAVAKFLNRHLLGGGGSWDPDETAETDIDMPDRQTVFFQDSAPDLMAKRKLGGEYWEEGGTSSPLDQLLPWRKAAKARQAEVVKIMKDLWHRKSSQDMLFSMLVLIHEYVQPVPEVASSAKGMDLPSLFCIMRHCRSNVFECVNDPTCKKSLDCLEACAFNDQVCQYRCIVSYESPQLESFSLCILQLHNCRGLSATAPAEPDPAPMPTFQGAPLTHEAAEKVLRGWLGEGPVSWLVAAGKNPAYDYFPCQHQLFFPGKARGAYWYEPVFKVKTLDGGEVWRRRRYRVRRAKLPGTFNLSVLDNGVTSKEFWRLLDAGDDLSFSLFYYSGAASAAGLSYSGAVLATPDGKWPAAEHLPRIEAALERAGIKMWELSNVDNSQCAGAPLQLSEEAITSLAKVAAMA